MGQSQGHPSMRNQAMKELPSLQAAQEVGTVSKPEVSNAPWFSGDFPIDFPFGVNTS